MAKTQAIVYKRLHDGEELNTLELQNGTIRRSVISCVAVFEGAVDRNGSVHQVSLIKGTENEFTCRPRSDFTGHV